MMIYSANIIFVLITIKFAYTQSENFSQKYQPLNTDEEVPGKVTPTNLRNVVHKPMPIKGVFEYAIYSDPACQTEYVLTVNGFVPNQCMYQSPSNYNMNVVTKVKGGFNSTNYFFSDSSCKKRLPLSDTNFFPSSCTSVGSNRHFMIASNPASFRTSFGVPGIKSTTYTKVEECKESEGKKSRENDHDDIYTYSFLPYDSCYGFEIVTQCNDKQHKVDRYNDITCKGDAANTFVYFKNNTCVGNYYPSNYECL